MTCRKCIQFRDRLTNATVIQNSVHNINGFIGLWENKDSTG